MAKTKIVIEIEAEDEHFVHAAGTVLVENTRTLLRQFSRHAIRANPEISITHDGKDVTEVIQ